MFAKMSKISIDPKSFFSFEDGTYIKSHLKHGVVKSDLSSAQLLQYNCFNFVVCTVMNVFAKTGNRQLDKLHENGISGYQLI